MIASVDLPWVLVLAGPIGLVAAALVFLSVRRQRRRWARLGTPELIAQLLPSHRPTHVWIPAVRVGTIVALLLVALAGPRWGVPSGENEVEGLDVVMAIDASASMLAEDEAPSRLVRARQEVQRFRAGSRGDRIGLIAFAGRSYILTPLTTDAGALELFLDHLDPSIVGQPGSSLAAAIVQGVDLLGPATSGDRALVLLTDGESFDDEAEMLVAARRARAARIALVFVGFGTAAGGTIPVDGADGRTTKRDADGNEVVSKYDASLLSRIADAGGGVVIDAAASDKATRIRAALAGLQASTRRVASRPTIPLRYHWFLVPAMVLLLIETLRGVRGRAAGVVLVALAGVLRPAPLSAQIARDLQRAEADFRAARPLPAARAWRSALEAGDRSPQTLFNLGTAFLAADSLDAAVEVLERAATAPNASVRDDAWFNLGLAYLRRGLAMRGEPGTASLRSAVRAYRQVLLAAPRDSAARFNYELALRALQSRAPAGGSSVGSGPARPQSSDAAIGRQQAEQLLDAAARDERATRGRQQTGPMGTATRGRDW